MISVMVMDEDRTPPNRRALVAPLKVVVAATEKPARARKVVALVVPATIRWVNFKFKSTLLFATTWASHANALAVAS